MKNKYSIPSEEKIHTLIKRGKEARKAGISEYDLVDTDLPLDYMDIIFWGYNYPDFEIGYPKTFYRIGEPTKNKFETAYVPSFNFAENRCEIGVSVVTTAWLNSLKSIFFGTYDEKIAEKGVYKIRGYILPHNGGDDEILILPIDWAEKTKIRTRTGLARAVKKGGF